MVASMGDAEDIIQECYCRLSDIEDVTLIGSPRAYLFTMARNLVLQEIRRAQIVRIEYVSEMERLDLTSDVPSPERIVAGRAELALVLKLIEALPPRVRQIVELRKVHGLSQKEIATRLGISINVVENEASRGLKAVLAQLTGSVSAPPATMDHDHDDARDRRRH